MATFQDWEKEEIEANEKVTRFRALHSWEQLRFWQKYLDGLDNILVEWMIDNDGGMNDTDIVVAFIYNTTKHVDEMIIDYWEEPDAE